MIYFRKFFFLAKFAKNKSLTKIKRFTVFSDIFQNESDDAKGKFQEISNAYKVLTEGTLKFLFIAWHPKTLFQSPLKYKQRY